uniref:Uncharacterized protein n=1 Tax=Daphnia magna TaxID=35525 RepID=A0A0P5XE89_9CRUS
MLCCVVCFLFCFDEALEFRCPPTPKDLRIFGAIVVRCRENEMESLYLPSSLHLSHVYVILESAQVFRFSFIHAPPPS